jgi:hypothetical protein
MSFPRRFWTASGSMNHDLSAGQFDLRDVHGGCLTT